MTKKEVSDDLKLFKSIVYLQIHRKLECKSIFGGGVMSTSEAVSYLMKNHKIPKNLCILVLKEMNNMGLIQFSKYEIIIIPGQSKCLDNVSRMSHDLGFW